MQGKFDFFNDRVVLEKVLQLMQENRISEAIDIALEYLDRPIPAKNPPNDSRELLGCQVC